MIEHNHDSGCECGEDHDEQMTVTLTLDDGTELECLVLTIFPIEEKKYIALLPISEENGEEDGEVFLYRFNELENEEIELINIESDDEYEIVADTFDQMLDEEEFDEISDEI
jgi:uncharacterized protein YrzB (UPF0473 family)